MILYLIISNESVHIHSTHYCFCVLFVNIVRMMKSNNYKQILYCILRPSKRSADHIQLERDLSEESKVIFLL